MTNPNTLATARANRLETLTLEQQIEVLTKELRTREHAASMILHPASIQYRQNQTEIAKLYDVLVDLNIRKIEGA